MMVCMVCITKEGGLFQPACGLVDSNRTARLLVGACIHRPDTNTPHRVNFSVFAWLAGGAGRGGGGVFFSNWMECGAGDGRVKVDGSSLSDLCGCLPVCALHREVFICLSV